jgi:hypothetical protein
MWALFLSHLTARVIPMTQLGKLEKVDVRKVWEHEARDFSAWLVKPENLELLSEQIGIDIEPTGTEIGMGRFRIDILAEEPRTGHKIIIENQLEATNHDHLGKVITYAAGLDAKYLIWIVKDVLPEHLKAIEWLNEHLDEEIRCFLIKIEVWQIGDSKPAPRFEIVSVKNDWAATLKISSVSGEFSSTKLRQKEYWEALCSYIRKKDQSIKLHTPAPQHWLNFSMGNSISHIALTLNTQKKRLGCELYISNDKTLFTYLNDNAEAIGASLGEEFSWFEGKVASGLGMYKSVTEVFDEAKQDDYFEWMYQKVILYKKVFGPYILKYREESKQS